MTAAGLTVLAADFHSPGPRDFVFPGFVGDFTKPMLLLVVAAVLIVAVLYAMARKSAVVPGRLQFAGEYVYNFVRNGIARDTIGSQDFMKFVPYLFALFCFVVVNNYFALIPFVQFPTFSIAGFVYPLAALTWIVYNYVGIAKHGFFGYLKLQSVPPGLTGPMLPLVALFEFFSNILVRPFTLALRLFANMFAGHLVLILFATGAEFLIFESGKIAYAPVGIVAFIIGLLVSLLEVLVLFLQAYVFTLLSSIYIGGAVADEH